jgi:membrane protease YdiL (CAAX protease family)
MNKRKLIIFLLCAFLPTIAAGMVMHLLGGSPSALSIEPLEGNKVQAITVIALTTAAMLFPMIAVIITQRVTKEPVLKGLDISFKINRWWFIGWILMPVIAMGGLGMTILMPGAKWTPDSETIQLALKLMPEGFGIWGMIGISLFSGLFAGVTINAVFAFGEEVAWRGYLLKLFNGKSFMATAIWTGIIWGFWHAPLILNGHNYPQHPVAGVLMMVVLSLLLSVLLMYFRQKSNSVIVPAIMHGTFNAVAGITNLVVTPFNDLLFGTPGLAGMLILLIIDLCIFIYDRYISKENIFLSTL